MKLEGAVGNRELYKFLAGKRDGKIIGVFSSGIYLKLDTKVLLLHDEQGGVLPFGISVPDYKNKATNFCVKPDMAVSTECGSLICPDGNLDIKLCFEETENKIISLEYLQLFKKRTKKYLLENKKSNFAIYACYEISEIDKNSIDDIFAKTAYCGILELTTALSNAEPQKIEVALMKLLGLGRGLTPSMDDFICGMLFVFNYAKKMWNYESGCVKIFNSLCKNLAPEKTNIYSSAYILAAAEGEDFSLMRNCIESAADESFDASIFRLLSVGSSSGADMLSGMCFAANYILGYYAFAS